MGIALIIPDVDFSGANLGQVHTGSPVLESITITGNPVAYKTAQYGISYYPSYPQFEGVTWSVESGGEYATIDADGLLTVTAGAMGQSVQIKAVSTYDPSIYDTFDIVVYDITVVEDGGVTFKQNLTTAIVPPALATAELEMRYKVTSIPTGGSDYGFMMGSRNGNTAGTSTDMFAVFMVGVSNEKGNGMFGATQTGNAFAVSVGEFLFKMNKDGVTVNGTDYQYTGTVGSVDPTRPIYIGKVNQPTLNSYTIKGGVLFNYIIIRDGDTVVHELVPYYESASDFGLFDKNTGTKYDVHSYTGASFENSFDEA